MAWSMRIGGWELTEVHDGRFRLDGGAMFGVVPKVLWQRLVPPDEQNRIPLALRCLLLRGHDRVALIDTGIGDKWSEKERSIYAIDHGDTDLRRDLARHGVAPEDVTDVLNTHLHFDHAGGNTRLDERGSVVPTFPRATYHVPVRNLEHALDPAQRDHVSYMPVNWQVLQQAGALRTFAPGAEVMPGVVAEESLGHTPGMVVYRIDGPEGTLVYCADLIPTGSHVRLNYVMGYDLCARTTVDEKRDLLVRAAEGDWVLFFEHDSVAPAARIHRDERGDYRVRELLGDSPGG